MFGKQKGTHPG